MAKIIQQPHGGSIQNFEKGESGNPNGRPKRGISLVNSQLAEEGIHPATKADIETNYMAMIQLGQDKLTEMANNKSQPMLIRIIAKNMLGGKGFDIVEKMLDRGIGKATQKIEQEIDLSQNGYDLLQDIKSGKLAKEQAYEAMQKSKQSN